MNYDPSLQKSIPQEIIDAAERVSRYFAERRMDNWKLGGCASREENDRLRNIETESWRVLTALVYANGGELRITPDAMQDAPRLILTRDDEHNAIVFRASLKAPAQTDEFGRDFRREPVRDIDIKTGQ